MGVVAVHLCTFVANEVFGNSTRYASRFEQADRRMPQGMKTDLTHVTASVSSFAQLLILDLVRAFWDKFRIGQVRNPIL